MPDEYWRWKIVFDTGWTLDQVDALTLKDYHEYFQVQDGVAKAAAVPRN